MALRLVRKSSIEPNITSTDDTISIRNAYLGYSGIVQNVGSELSLSIYNMAESITLRSGRVVIDGWEVDIEEQEITVSDSSYETYDFLYLEINLLLEEATLKIIRSGQTEFPLDKGDDLSRYPSGTARIPLYRWSVYENQKYDEKTLAKIIPYAYEMYDKINKDIDDIDRRLTLLGFKQGSVTPPSNTSSMTFNVAENWLTRQGDYIVGQYIFRGPDLNTSEGFDPKQQIIGIVPKDFRPETEIELVGCAWVVVSLFDTSVEYRPVIFAIAPDGNIRLKNFYRFPNSGSGDPPYRASNCYLQFGYKAKSLVS